MDIQTIRISNILNLNGFLPQIEQVKEEYILSTPINIPAKIKGIGESTIMCECADEIRLISEKDDNLKGVYINEEILSTIDYTIKENEENNFYIGGFCVKFIDDIGFFVESYDDFGKEYMIRICYLHELQNMYYDMTYRTLNIDLNKLKTILNFKNNETLL